MTLTAERLRVVMPRFAAALQEAAQDVHLTNDELLAITAYLTEVGKTEEFILLSDVLGLSRLVDDLTHEGEPGTESNVLGPFYRPGAPFIDNPGSIVRGPVAGEPLRFEGRITDAASGEPLTAVVDIWQADGAGRYSDEVDLGDPWALRGRQRTGEDGRFAIETVRPLHYTIKHDGPVGQLLAALARHPWRPAHIHVLVDAPGHAAVATQAYVAAGPYLEDDAINGVKSSLIVPIEDGRMTFDIALSVDRRIRSA